MLICFLIISCIKEMIVSLVSECTSVVFYLTDNIQTFKDTIEIIYYLITIYYLININGKKKLG